MLTSKNSIARIPNYREENQNKTEKPPFGGFFVIRGVENEPLTPSHRLIQNEPLTPSPSVKRAERK